MAAGIGLLASAIYVPSIPRIAVDLQATVPAVQLTLTVYLLVFAGAMLAVGPLSDRYGRRPVLLGGIGVAALAALACAVAPSIEALMAARVVQALGASTGMVVGRALVRDLYDANNAQRPMALMGVAAGIAPALAPLLGGFIEEYLGWRYQFLFTFAFCAILLGLILAGLPETNRQPLRDRGLFDGMRGSFARLLSSRAFIFFALPITAGSFGFYAFVAGAPAVLVGHLGVTPATFGLYAALPPLGFITGSFMMSRLGPRLGPGRSVMAGASGHVLSGLLLACGAVFFMAAPLGLAIPMLVFGFFNGMMMPAAFAGSVSVDPRIAGAASGLAGFLQMIVGAVGTLTASAIDHQTIAALALLIAAAAWFSFAAARLVGVPRPASPARPAAD